MLLFSLTAHAEYRVFQLRLTKTDGFTKEVLSTLDAYQYTSYYPVEPDVSVEYVDSWLCLGDTSNFRKYCEKPITREAASIEEPNPDNQ